MTEKTLEQIRQEYGSRAAALMNARHDRVEEIAAERRLPDGEYLDRLTDEQRNHILLERKTAAAGGPRRPPPSAVPGSARPLRGGPRRAGGGPPMGAVGVGEVPS